ncbi:hypothetical protein IE81DRAFT_123477 [Ceraceosorus guamensis]|uniref:Uncharacterized protein n=1 Tax=Ceraceosorus guamensis TaxID=1522189 RepID=A0A316W126_9BASI|nr:hypothetical protein IE81DRAFT_123477 [Ceraceosorus guamensis]PWN42443.1 hypothetical protein IE81DRAFT_123477 [Ceraceosorus guamensis]
MLKVTSHLLNTLVALRACSHSGTRAIRGTTTAINKREPATTSRSVRVALVMHGTSGCMSPSHSGNTLALRQSLELRHARPRLPSSSSAYVYAVSRMHGLLRSQRDDVAARLTHSPLRLTLVDVEEEPIRVRN